MNHFKPLLKRAIQALLICCWSFSMTSCGGGDSDTKGADSKKKSNKNTSGRIQIDHSMDAEAMAFISNQEHVLGFGVVNLNELINKRFRTQRFTVFRR